MFYVLLCITLCPFKFCNHELVALLSLSSWCIMIVVLLFLVYYDCCVALPRGAIGLSAVYDCNISWSYSLFFVPSLKLEHCCRYLLKLNLYVKHYVVM